MTWLGIDTATDRASVAVEHGEAVYTAALDGARKHARALPALIDEALAGAGAQLDDVRGVVLADGPGSFTGLRVGAAVAKALVRARGLPLWTAASLLGRAYRSAPHDGSLVVVMAEALRGDVYAAAYRIHPAAVETVVAPGVMRPEDVRDRCGAPDLLVSAASSDASLAVHLGAAPVIEADATAADASALLALRKLAGGAAPVTDVAGWEPHYGRPAEAQVRWEETHGRPLPDQTGARG